MFFMCTITGLYEKSPLSAKACHSLQCFHSKGRIITPWESSWLMTNNTQEFLVLCQKPWQKFWNCLLPWVCKWFALCDGQCAGGPAGSLCLTDPIRFCPTVTLWSTKAKQNTHLHALKHYQQLISVFDNLKPIVFFLICHSAAVWDLPVLLIYACLIIFHIKK